VQTSAGEWLQSFVQVFEYNRMIEHPALEKYVSSFHIIQTKSFCVCVVMGIGKSHNKNKGTMSYVVILIMRKD
jgi:hypothetical protein